MGEWEETLLRGRHDYPSAEWAGNKKRKAKKTQEDPEKKQFDQ